MLFLKNYFARQPQICIVCVAENTPQFHTEVFWLFKSISIFGGRLNQAKKIACFVNAVDAEVERSLSFIGVEIRIVSPLDDRLPLMNKIRMLDEVGDCDVLIGLDCDIVVLRDFSKMVSVRNFRAAATGFDTYSLKEWELIYGHFKIKLPRQRVTTACTAVSQVPYFNSGVIMIPKRFQVQIRDAWKYYAAELLTLCDSVPFLASNKFYAEQTGLSIALSSKLIPVSILPIEMNFHTNASIHPQFSPQKMTPYIIHHHHRLNSSGLFDSGYPLLDEHFRKINSSITQSVA
ncbi:MAG: hypothetical protein Q7S47_02065 [bacterium]|nr:hypothetical protein [bacterium]